MNIILFRLGAAQYGLPADSVSQVVEPPALTPIPFVPPAFEGLVNVGGRVLVQVDAALRLGLGEAQPSGSGEVFVVRVADGAYALRVARVLMMVSVEEDVIARVDSDGQTAAAGFASGSFHWQNGTVLLLDPEALGFAALPDGEERSAGALFDAQQAVQQAVAAETLTPFLVVSVGAEACAFALSDVVEVAPALEVVALPGAPSEVAGLAQLRGAPLLVLSLARMLDVAETRGGGGMVVVRAGDEPLGLQVARIDGIRRVRDDAVGGIGEGQGLLSGYFTEDGKDIVGIVESERLFDAARLATLRRHLPHRHRAVGPAGREAGRQTSRRLLGFWVGDELCGIDLDRVSRVAEHQGCDGVPGGAHADLAGVVESGSQVLPVVDLRRRLGGGAAAGAGSVQVVATVRGHACALVVDRLHRIVELAESHLQPAEAGANALVAAIGRAASGLMSVLAADALLDEVVS